MMRYSRKLWFRLSILVQISFDKFQFAIKQVRNQAQKPDCGLAVFNWKKDAFNGILNAIVVGGEDFGSV